MTDTLPQWRLTPDQEAHVRLWIAALRSGQYQQTQLALHRLVATEAEPGAASIGYPVGWCCLGVACDLADTAGVRVERNTKPGTDRETFDGDSLWPPNSMLRWLGLDPMRRTILARLNDTARKTFDEIADVIDGWLDEALIESEVPC